METSSKPSFSLDLPPDGLLLGDNGVPSPLYSPYDMLETARIDAHQLLSSLHRFAETWGLPRDPAEELQALAGKLERLVSHWEDIVDGLQGVRREVEPLSFQVSELQLELSRMKDERDEQRRLFERQIQQVQATSDQRLSEIAKDLDELIYRRVSLHRPKQAFDNILPALFSEEDLLEEQRVALGEQPRLPRDVKIHKLDLSQESGPHWELGHSSGQSDSISLSHAPPEERELCAQLQAVLRKIREYRKKENVPRSSGQSLDDAIFAELAMESASKIDIRPHTASISHLNRSFSQGNKLDLALPLAGIAFTPLYNPGSLSVSKQESFIFSLMHGRREGYERDVVLADLLNVTNGRLSQDTDSVGDVGERKEEDRNGETEEFGEKQELNESSRVISFEEAVVQKHSSPIHIPLLHLDRLSPKPTSPSFLKSSPRADLINLSAFEGASSISLVLEEEKRESPVDQKFDLFEALEKSSSEDVYEKQPSKPTSSPPGVNPRRLHFKLLQLREKNDTAHIYLSPTNLADFIANTSVPMPDIMVSKPNSPVRAVANLRLRKYRHVQ